MGCCASTQTDKPLLSLEPEPWYEPASIAPQSCESDSPYILENDEFVV